MLQTLYIDEEIASPVITSYKLYHQRRLRRNLSDVSIGSSVFYMPGGLLNLIETLWTVPTTVERLRGRCRNRERETHCHTTTLCQVPGGYSFIYIIIYSKRQHHNFFVSTYGV
jgi:hypothetical protein